MNKYLYAALLFLPLWSCNVSESLDQAKIAERQTQLFYSVVNRNVDSTLNLFDVSFFQDVSRENFKAFLKEIEEKYGPVMKYELVKTEKGIARIHGEKLNYMFLHYKTVYKSGFTSVERFTFRTDDKNFESIDGWSFYEWGKAPSN